MTNEEIVKIVGMENIISIAGLLGCYEGRGDAVIVDEDEFAAIVMGVAKDFAQACAGEATPLDSWAVFEKGIQVRINERGD